MLPPSPWVKKSNFPPEHPKRDEKNSRHSLTVKVGRPPTEPTYETHFRETGGTYHFGTNNPAGNLVQKNIGGRTTRYKVYPNLLKRLKKVEKLRRLKSQPMFSEPRKRGFCHSLWVPKFPVLPCER